MNKAKDDEPRVEYTSDSLGKGVRGKHFAAYSAGTNLVLLDDAVAKAFPTSEAVNEALLGLLELTERTARLRTRNPKAAKNRASA
jgi:hypothetical protein